MDYGGGDLPGQPSIVALCQMLTVFGAKGRGLDGGAVS